VTGCDGEISAALREKEVSTGVVVSRTLALPEGTRMSEVARMVLTDTARSQVTRDRDSFI
jgi:hypothetical protein